ncbi:OmpA family protein [Pseudoxanthomonas sp. PXM03]|uniref:OmpA family protein n=1 Tax=Pseudoxanthomonas sp. PXM03 TaxID=2769284 RepID=UPI0017868362|nr:OmpA family protein [Pseudoxanthomonas sp. PXM03]MBD9437638.1 OmpA family protein [Pseudoxanthomonas sp. PXM03]
MSQKAAQWTAAVLAFSMVSTAAAETTFHRINFDINSSNLRPDSVAILHEGAELMMRNPEMKARIEGSACATEEGSNQLWFHRAIAARTFLVQHGVDPSQILSVTAVSPKWQADTARAENVPCSERLRAVFFIDARISP